MIVSSHVAENAGPLYTRLAAWGQEHVLRWWSDLAPRQRHQLVRQIEAIDLELVQRVCQQSESSAVGQTPPPQAIRPAGAIPLAASAAEAEDQEQIAQRGRQALRAGQVAVVLVAGGQGTRLGHAGPKGTFPIGPVSGKSLFQLHAEKVLALGRQYDVRVPLYVMTSPDNDAASRDFFADHACFGLDQDQVVFFRQGTMPALDRQTGRLLLDAKHRIATSPNGHGGVVKALVDGGHLDDMHRQRVEYIFYYQVDNPLVKVADPTFLGHHLRAEAEMSLKVVRKLRPEEKLGVVVEVDGHLQMIEYSDLPAEVAQRRLPDGGLEIWTGSIAVHIFNVSFLRRLAAGGTTLPYHQALKNVPYLNQQGRRVTPEEPNAVKCEMFVFDALPLARHALVVETDRREEFEPLKNAIGENSPETVRQAMSDLYAGWLDRAGVQVTRQRGGSVAFPLEISPLLDLNRMDIRARLSERTPVNGPMLLEKRNGTGVTITTTVKAESEETC
ncbi:MAG: UDPGP type 1 family protein [Pirellulales bacterium]|nr:UDPGP type 1 family protein [Pirellulales bacterium]